MVGKLEEVRQILTANWHLNAPTHTNTTPCIAFLRYLIALLEPERSSSFLGQLKTLLTGAQASCVKGSSRSMEHRIRDRISSS